MKMNRELRVEESIAVVIDVGSLLSDFDPEAGDDRMRMFPFSITP